MASKPVKSIYLIAICGTGMASLAGLLKKSGYQVSGSDQNIYPPMSTLLEQAGIPVSEGFRRENVPPDIDLVIIGNAVSKTNQEVQAVIEGGLPYMSFPQAIAHFFLENRKSLVVAGTHGKTTTTSLLSWVLHHSGRKPGFMVGGWLRNFDCNYQVPEGDCFVIEGDEYDTAFFDKEPKFLHYQPYAAILTGIEFDHADIYRDLSHMQSSFKKFVEIIHPDGFLLVEFSNEPTRDILGGAPCAVETYGFAPEADWSLSAYRFEDGWVNFTLSHNQDKVGTFRLPMMGKYNVENAAAVVALSVKLGLSSEEINRAFEEFSGIKRRQEVVGEKNEVVVIDDFAHHPTAIRHTIEAVKEAYPRHRVWAVFEPRSATSRRNVFQEQLPDSFFPADRIVIAGLFSPEKIPPENRLDPARIIENLRARNKEAWFLPDVEAIVGFIVEHACPGDVILIMSSGGFGGIHQKLLDRL